LIIGVGLKGVDAVLEFYLVKSLSSDEYDFELLYVPLSMLFAGVWILTNFLSTFFGGEMLLLLNDDCNFVGPSLS